MLIIDLSIWLMPDASTPDTTPRLRSGGAASPSHRTHVSPGQNATFAASEDGGPGDGGTLSRSVGGLFGFSDTE